MATQLFPISSGVGTEPAVIPDNRAKFGGANDGWFPQLLRNTRGGVDVASSNEATVTGPTAGIEIGNSSFPFQWITYPVDQDVTISGSITFNVWASESSMSANVAINVAVYKVAAVDQAITLIHKTVRTTELGTSAAAENWSETPGAGVALAKGDRLLVVFFGDDAGTMASGFTFLIRYGGPTGGASGDTYVTFTETFAFTTATPAGTQLFLTDVAGPAVGADVEKEMWTARGDGVNTAVRNTLAGWTAGVQWTDTAGGTNIEWYSKQLAAFTLADLVRANLRLACTGAGANAGAKVELAVVNNDGTGAVVWGVGSYYTPGAVSSTDYGKIVSGTEVVHDWVFAGDDISVSAGQRLRLRVILDDFQCNPVVTGQTATLWYDGTSGGASGDSFIRLSQAVTESAAATAIFHEPILALQAVNRSNVY